MDDSQDQEKRQIQVYNVSLSRASDQRWIYYYQSNYFPKLTKREATIFYEMLCVKSNKSIAATLNLTEKNVKFYNTIIYKKMNVKSRLELLEKYSHIIYGGNQR